MVKLSRWMIVIFLLSLLLACASARMAEEVQSAKATFNSGNFKQAFAELMPLAVKCSAEAEYAVGYMYYYGLGVEAHKESGLFWIGQSAAQMYRPAIRALQLIEKDKIESHKIPTKKSNKIHYSENSLTETLKNPDIQHKMAAIKKENTVDENLVHMAVKVTPENKEDEVLMSLKDLNSALVETTHIKPSVTLAKIPSSNFTLQLFGSYKLEDVKQLQSQLNLQTKTYYAQTKHNGRDWYILTYGKYPEISLAKHAKEDMPIKAQKLDPWVRNTSDLRWVG